MAQTTEVEPTSAGGQSALEAVRAEYEKRGRARRKELDQLNQREGLVGNLRVAAIAALLIVGYFTLFAETLALWWILLPLAAVIAVVSWHRRVFRQIEAVKRTLQFYKRGLARLKDQWHQFGSTGEQFLSAAHPYSGDLDLFGPRSLFQLICIARTPLGEQTLADWLQRPAEAETVRQRQEAVAELRDQLDLREELAALDAKPLKQLNPDYLLEWIEQPPRLTDKILPRVALVLGVLMGIALGGWIFAFWGPGPAALLVLIEIGVLFSMRSILGKLARELDELLPDLDLLSQVLAIVEKCEFSSPLLKQLVSEVQVTGQPPSKQIARLHGLAENYESARRNQLIAPLAFLFMWIVQIVYALERWRTEIGPKIRAWVDTVGQFEALVCLACYAYEHPDACTPEISEDVRGFDAEQLGHPLIAREECVRNDVQLTGQRQLILVSGSNMSGKSTLLRAVGSNVVLALAGSVVVAKSLKVGPVQLGTVMRVQDSLQSHTSHFMAEIKRLQSIVELAKSPPTLLFLFDEILHGTNSHDRLKGAEAVILKLLEQGAIGLVTTHDLALAEIAESLEAKAVNVHFQDEIINGQMVFDYKMREGIVTKSNALELMRSLGLDV